MLWFRDIDPKNVTEITAYRIANLFVKCKLYLSIHPFNLIYCRPVHLVRVVTIIPSVAMVEVPILASQAQYLNRA